MKNTPRRLTSRRIKSIISRKIENIYGFFATIRRTEKTREGAKRDYAKYQKQYRAARGLRVLASEKCLRQLTTWRHRQTLAKMKTNIPASIAIRPPHYESDSTPQGTEVRFYESTRLTRYRAPWDQRLDSSGSDATIDQPPHTYIHWHLPHTMTTTNRRRRYNCWELHVHNICITKLWALSSYFVYLHGFLLAMFSSREV